MKKKILISIMAFSFIFIISSFGAFKLKAGATGNMDKWSWGGGADTFTNVRWISMNSENGSGGIEYGVNVPRNDGDVTGYAWSGGDDGGLGLGYINFDPAGPYPTVATGDDYAHDVRRIGDKLVGWARFEQIASANAVGNSGGWEGWIRMSSDADDSYNYGVEVSKVDGDSATSTYAWSDELGWIDFGQADIVFPPKVELRVGGSTVAYQLDLNEGETTPQSINLEWEIKDGDDADYCVAECEYGNCGTWNDESLDADGDGNFHTEEKVVGSIGIIQSEAVSVSNTTTYSITCYNKAGSDTAKITIIPGCKTSVCESEGTCNQDGFVATTNGSSSVCKDDCTQNKDCVASSYFNWREVAP